MKIEGETSKAYIESLKSALREYDEINCSHVCDEAMKPESALKLHVKYRGRTVQEIQNDLAQHLASMATQYSAQNHDLADGEMQAFLAIVKTLSQVEAIGPMTYCALIAIKNLASHYPPKYALNYEDALDLIKIFIF